MRTKKKKGAAESCCFGLAAKSRGVWVVDSGRDSAPRFGVKLLIGKSRANLIEATVGFTWFVKDGPRIVSSNGSFTNLNDAICSLLDYLVHERGFPRNTTRTLLANSIKRC